VFTHAISNAFTYAIQYDISVSALY
jgi:hypothetical protein